MTHISQGLRNAVSKAQLERMLKTTSWYLYCETCQRDTRHWHRADTGEHMIIFCGNCNEDRRFRLTEQF